MYLKALEIQGFKSFPEKTVLTFGEAVTGVVGPNGSGKSNIADAVRWVMGEQSTRALRGGKMEDVIFGGTARRKPLGCAEVSLLLDNSDGALPVDSSEVAVTRRYYRSGEGEYYINRRACRLRDVNELFMDTGLGREGYSLFGQGRIDEILSTRGGERRAVFEEAAGISRFRHRKEDAERRLERTEENLLRIGDKISELELQLRPLAEQAEQARAYLALREQLRGLEVSLWMDDLDRLRQRTRQLAADAEHAAQRREQAAAAQEARYARAQALAAQLQEQDVRAEELRGRQREVSELSSRCAADLAVLRTQSLSNEQTIQRLRGELERQSGRAGSIAAQIQERKERFAALDARRKDAEQSLSALEGQSADSGRTLRELSDAIEQLQKQETLRSGEAAGAREQLSALAAAEQELLDRETSLRGQLQQAQERASSFAREAQTREETLTHLREEEKRLRNALNGHTLRLEGRRQRLEAASERVNRLSVESGGLHSRIQMLAEMEKLYEGYSRAVRTVMQAVQRNQLRGIHGPAASLIKTRERDTVAIEIALGAAAQHLVVEREEDAKVAINYLQRRDAGRATFLPLTAIRASTLRETGLERCRGYVGIASELVSCQDCYADVIGSLLGRVVVVRSLDDAIPIARQYRHRFKIVTLDGQVLHAGGSMTGGSASRSAGVLSRAGELERLRKQSAALEETLRRAQKERQDAQRDSDLAEQELLAAREQLQQLEGTILRTEAEREQYQRLLDTLRADNGRARQELEAIAERGEQLESGTQDARTRLTALEGEAEALRVQAQAKAEARERCQRQREALEHSIAQTRTQQAALEAEYTASLQALRELEALERDLSGDREERLRQLESCQETDTALRERIAAAQDQQTALSRQKEALDTSLSRLTAQRMQVEGERVQADQAARAQNEELLRLERECAQLEQKHAAAVLEEQQLLTRLWDTYALTYDSAQPHRLSLPSAARATRQIAQIRDQLDALGDVNVGAVEEYRRVRERFDFLTAQRDDSTHAKDELLRIIGAITDEMRGIFREQFTRINDAFSQTFQELFGGGRAHLVLEEGQDILTGSIDIQVQPPGKALKTLTLLSGGERAFVAIALYFAFMKVRPTPFVVMDEIEAALDESNVTRFARYVRSMSEKTQFIIITHRRGTMEEADLLYGVTMIERGVSRVLSLNLNQAEQIIRRRKTPPR